MVKIANIVAICAMFQIISCQIDQDKFSDFNQFEQTGTNETIFQRLVLSKPEDVGFGHTTIIHNLQQRMEMNFPKTQKQYLQAISLAISEHLCDPFDLSCNNRVMKNTIDLKVGPQGKAESGIEHLKINLLPNDFDPIVMESLEKLFFTISLADLNEDLVDVLSIMNKDFEELKARVDVSNEAHRTVGLVSYAVGMESAKQWHEIFNDKENPFHRFVRMNRASKERRNQQVTDLLGPLVANAGEIANNFIAGVTGPDAEDSTTFDIAGGISALGSTSLAQNQITTILDIPDEDFDIDYTKLLEADIIGASAGAIVGSFDRISGDKLDSSILSHTVEQASVSSAKQVVEDLSPQNPETCLFPGTMLCSEKNGPNDKNPHVETPIDPKNPQNCKYPNSPYCNTTIPNLNEKVSPSGCLFPGSPYC